MEPENSNCPSYIRSLLKRASVDYQGELVLPMFPQENILGQQTTPSANKLILHITYIQDVLYTTDIQISGLTTGYLVFNISRSNPIVLAFVLIQLVFNGNT